MSLESGSMLWRLNHVLLPEPGSPMDRTTAPFGLVAEEDWAGAVAGTAGSLSSPEPSASAASPVGPPGDGRAGAWAGVAGRLPRPRRPRLRERCAARAGCGWPGSSPSPLLASAAKGSSMPPSSSATSGEGSGAASCGNSLLSSRSGKRGCKGSGFSCGGCSVVCCLRRLPRSRIHLRM